MSPLRSLLLAKLRIAWHSIVAVRNESRLKVGVVSVAAVLLWFGALYLFCYGFGFLQQQGLGDSGDGLSVSDIVMARLLNVLALALFFMLMFSNILIAFSTLYRSHEVSYLIHVPLSWQTYFLSRFVECVAFSSWASAFLGSPLIIAYGLSTNAPLMFYATAVVFYLPYVVIPAALGNMIAMLLVRVFPSLRTSTVVFIALASIAAFGTYLWNIMGRVQFTDQAFFSSLMEATQQTQSPLLPSSWAARGLLSTVTGAHVETLFYWLLLVSNAMLMTWLAAELAARVFFPGWSSLQGQEVRRRKGRRVTSRIDGWVRRLREPVRSLTLKDIKLFWRDPVQWTQFVLFFGLMAVYVANLQSTAGFYEKSPWRHGVVALNAAACTLILATLTSRFVFPLISLEGRRFWILGLAPLTLRQLMWQKFWLSVSATLSFTLALVIISCAILRVDSAAFFLCVYAIVASTFGLAGLAVGLGSLYPNFQENNPARIVSSMGGTLNFLLSMGYIIVVVGVQGTVLMWSNFGGQAASYPIALGVALALITGLSGLCMWLPMRLGLRNLQQVEF
jgi:ABC-2 type transport system permease protein